MVKRFAIDYSCYFRSCMHMSTGLHTIGI